MTRYIYESSAGPVAIDARTADLLQQSRSGIVYQGFDVVCSGCTGRGCNLCGAEPSKPKRRRGRSYVFDLRKGA